MRYSSHKNGDWSDDAGFRKPFPDLDSGPGVKRMSGGLSASFFEPRFDRGLSYLALAIEAKHASSREMQLGFNAQICGFGIARAEISSKTNGAFISGGSFASISQN